MTTSAPSEALGTWIESVPRGRALDLGAGDGETSAWLAQHGFRVDAVEADPDRFESLRKSTRGLPVHLHPLRIMQFRPAENAYSLIVASAVLHFFAPSDLTLLAGRLRRSLVEGGILIAEAFTTDDPGYAVLRRENVREIEPNTFEAPPLVGLIHYFEPRELEKLFSELKLLEYVEERRLDPTSPEGYRAGALLVAQRQPTAVGPDRESVE
jgi:cyclopropane fatty-acyl-phospholipid synthase-like methyltransferase